MCKYCNVDKSKDKQRFLCLILQIYWVYYEKSNKFVSYKVIWILSAIAYFFKTIFFLDRKIYNHLKKLKLTVYEYWVI